MKVKNTHSQAHRHTNRRVRTTRLLYASGVYRRNNSFVFQECRIEYVTVFTVVM